MNLGCNYEEPTLQINRIKKNYHHKQTKFYEEKHFVVFLRTLWAFIIAYVIFNKLETELGQDFSIPLNDDSL